MTDYIVDYRYFGDYVERCGRTHDCAFCDQPVKYRSKEVRIPVRWKHWDKGAHVLCYVKALRQVSSFVEKELLRQAL